jgi:hypothetical protein
MVLKKAILEAILCATLCACQDAGVAPDASSAGRIYPPLPELLYPPVAGAQIMPLATGNSWTFVDSLFNIDGSQESHTFVWTISGRERILAGSESIDVYILNLEVTGPGIYVRTEPEGLCQYTSGENSLPGHHDLRTLWVKYPIAEGDSFVSNHGDYVDRFTCLSVDTLLTSPVGRFRCFMVRDNPAGSWYTDIFYRPGVGKMGEINYDLTGPPLVRYKRWLVSYKIG